MSGCLPAHNNFDTADQSVDSPTAVHWRSFFGIQCCRLSRTLRLFIPRIHNMVREATFGNLHGKDAVHTPFSDVQCPAWQLGNIACACHILRFHIYAFIIHFWMVKWIRFELVFDGCTVAQSQSSIEGQIRRCGCCCNRCKFFPCWRVGDREFFQFCRQRCHLFL